MPLRSRASGHRGQRVEAGQVGEGCSPTAKHLPYIPQPAPGGYDWVSQHPESNRMGQPGKAEVDGGAGKRTECPSLKATRRAHPPFLRVASLQTLSH